MKAEPCAASDQTAEIQRRRIASCRRYADVIDNAAPEIARACRNLGVRSEGVKWLMEPKQWVFETGPGAHITIKSTGKWYFSDPTARRLHEKVDKYYCWENCETRNGERIVEDLKAQVEKKAMPRRPIVYKQHWRLVHWSQAAQLSATGAGVAMQWKTLEAWGSTGPPTRRNHGDGFRGPLPRPLPTVLSHRQQPRRCGFQLNLWSFQVDKDGHRNMPGGCERMGTPPLNTAHGPGAPLSTA